VAHLVDEDQQDEPDRELPAPDQRVAADGDEDRGELREREAELRDQADRDRDRRPDPARERAPERLGVDRPVVALRRRLVLEMAHRPTFGR
jgi:hypothetical protein